MQIHELNTLGRDPAGTDFLAIDTGFDTAKISATEILNPAMRKADKANTYKVNIPVDANNDPDNGTAGQLLRTEGNGKTKWVNAGTPTQAQVEQAVNDWLDDHPEATTTVENGSVTNAKLYPVGNTIDLQGTRADASQTASAPYSFIAGGGNNTIKDIVEMGSHARYSHAEGLANRAFNWESHVEGSGSIADGKISHAEGNGVICSSNDAHAEGNRTVAGRRYYPGVSVGSEDAGDSLGVLNYVLIPDAEGDVTSFFPNALIDNVETRYGAGAQKDSVGNIYPPGMTPAVWDGDTLVQEKSLQWALHRICILRGAGENDIQYVTIAKCTYTGGVGTKVYYFGDNPTTGTMGIYSSYAPTLLDGGNGAHAEGLFTSSWGYGAHAEGYGSNGFGPNRAWGHGAHAEGVAAQALEYAAHAENFGTKASALYSHAEGRDSIASGAAAHAEGWTNTASNQGAHAEGENTIASGEASHSEGSATTASGRYAHAEGELTVASGNNSHAEGYRTTASEYYAHAEGADNTASGRYSHVEGSENTASAFYANAAGKNAIANRMFQKAWAAGKISENGDMQYCEILTAATVNGVGWFNVNLISNVENGKAYSVDIDIMGRQIEGSAETVGNTFSYNIKAIIARDSGGTATVIGTPIRTLIGRSAGMSGDGLSSGIRVSLYNGIYPTGEAIALRYDGVADTKYQLLAHTKWIEMKI